MGKPKKFIAGTTGISDSNNKDNLTVINNSNSQIKYLIIGPGKKLTKSKCRDHTQKYVEFNNIFTGLDFWMGHCHCSKPYQAPKERITKPFEEELEQLQQQDIITTLGIDEKEEWYKSFVLVTNPTGKVRLCLDPARINQAFI